MQRGCPNLPWKFPLDSLQWRQLIDSQIQLKIGLLRSHESARALPSVNFESLPSGALLLYQYPYDIYIYLYSLVGYVYII